MAAKQEVKFSINGTDYRITPSHKGGFNVATGCCNPMPAATGGFKTIEQAVLAIRVLEHSGGDSDRFWDLWYRVSGVTQRGREERRRLADHLGMVCTRLGKNTYHFAARKAA